MTGNERPAFYGFLATTLLIGSSIAIAIVCVNSLQLLFGY
jgi:hypothetical protein